MKMRFIFRFSLSLIFASAVGGTKAVIMTHTQAVAIALEKQDVDEDS